MIALMILLSCGGPQAESEPEIVHSNEEAFRLQPLDAPRLLRRLSLDLRGVLPTGRRGRGPRRARAPRIILGGTKDRQG